MQAYQTRSALIAEQTGSWFARKLGSKREGKVSNQKVFKDKTRQKFAAKGEAPAKGEGRHAKNRSWQMSRDAEGRRGTK